VASIEASKGESLGDSEAYDSDIGALPAERIAAFFVDPKAILDLGASTADLGGAELATQQAALAQAKPVVAAVTADANGLVVDSATDVVPGLTMPVGTGSVLGELPGDSGIALGVPDLGAAIKTSVDQATEGSGMDPQTLNLFLSTQTGIDALGILDWLGDTGAFVSGNSFDDLSAGVVIQSSDPDASAQTLDSIQSFLEKNGDIKIGKALVDGDAGFSVQVKDLPQPVVVEQSGSKVVIGYGTAGAEQALSTTDRLADNPDYAAAAGRLGEGYAPTGYVGLASILQLAVNEFKLDKQQWWAAVGPYLEPFQDVIAGSHAEGDKIYSRLRLDIE
jgi:hypothetical protein